MIIAYILSFLFIALSIRFVNRKRANRKMQLELLAKNLLVCSNHTVQEVLDSLSKTERSIVVYEIGYLNDIKHKRDLYEKNKEDL